MWKLEEFLSSYNIRNFKNNSKESSRRKIVKIGTNIKQNTTKTQSKM